MTEEGNREREREREGDDGMDGSKRHESTTEGDPSNRSVHADLFGRL